MLWAQPRFGHGSCHWSRVQERYPLLGFHWAGYADLADEGDDLAALQPLGTLFLSRDSMSPNMIEGHQPETERIRATIAGHTLIK
jgi:hypothetical protein